LYSGEISLKANVFETFGYQHKAFPGLENPLDSRSYGKTKFHIDKAYEIRNRIAHFDETDTADYQKEELLLLWLVDVLGGFSSEF
jgi:hypothetical protein